MRTYFRSILFLLLFIVFGNTSTNGQSVPTKGTIGCNITVAGNCEHCKATIEKAALKMPGVKLAIWDQETKNLKVVFKADKTSPDEIRKSIAAVGYDTDHIKGDDIAYANLPECCRYERLTYPKE